jgi:hypothetical protein
VSYIQKFNDPSVKIGGVSINSTLREAKAALPDWRSVSCPDMTLLIAPDGRTNFEFPLGFDTGNSAGSNGIVVNVDPLAPDRSACV